MNVFFYSIGGNEKRNYFSGFKNNSDLNWIHLRERENSIIVMIYSRALLKELLGMDVLMK